MSEQWLKEMCEDWRLDHDPHTKGMQLAINYKLHEQCNELAALKLANRDLQHRLDDARARIAEPGSCACNDESPCKYHAERSEHGRSWLLRKQADAVEQCWNMANDTPSLEWLIDSLADYQLWLVKQADEIEKAGGGQ